jgi:hypothetical protein
MTTPTTQLDRIRAVRLPLHQALVSAALAILLASGCAQSPQRP